VEFEWDERKAAENLRKHGVDFADAALVLEDDLALTVEDPDAQGEERWVTMGHDPNQRVLVLAYTWRGGRIRLISARKATGAERRRYETGP
jgi:uncharacterized DUF497 family protein